MSQTQEIKSRLNIVDIVGDYVQLKRSGAIHWGLCPFHSEKTPSFSVSAERQSFHCFGCGKGGDAFSFIMEMEGLTFPEALQQLADRAGVTLEKLSPRAPKSRERELSPDLLEEAQRFFRQSLESESATVAQSYLKERTLSRSDQAEFELGWAPASWNSLTNYLLTRGVAESILLNSGLSVRSDKGFYDRFRSRIMFPIRDDREKLVGFGGRLIHADGAKYLNSPEGELFNKRKLLYFLGRAKREAREKKRLILVEGYMDAIRAHQVGFKETVASLGTALTQEQSALIKRFTDLVYICYDADSAGQEAALRGMYLLQRSGVEVRVVTLPVGQDPDDVLLLHGASFFEDYLQKSHPLARYHALVRKPMLNDPAQKNKAREDLLSGLASLPVLDVAPHLPAISQLFGVLPHELQAELSVYKESRKNAPKEAVTSHGHLPSDGEGESVVDDLECMLCSRLWSDSALCSKLKAETLLPLLNDSRVSAIALALLSGERQDELLERWQQIGDKESVRLIARGDALTARDALGQVEIEEFLTLLQRRKMQALYMEAKVRVLSGRATQEDFKCYEDYAKRLKSGGGLR